MKLLYKYNESVTSTYLNQHRLALCPRSTQMIFQKCLFSVQLISKKARSNKLCLGFIRLEISTETLGQVSALGDLLGIAGDLQNVALCLGLEGKRVLDT